MQIPTELYAIVGALIITNLSAIGALIVFIFKCGIFVANTNSGIKKAQETANRSHNRIDNIESFLHR